MMARIPVLDGIRGLAILLVLHWHWVACSLKPATAFSGVYGLTWSGVDLFFVLSGFLISGILMDLKGDERYYAKFYTRRARRILPLYWLLLASYFVMVRSGASADFPGLFRDPLPLRYFPAFLQNYAMVGRRGWGAAWLDPTWSLAVEEQFYLVLPVIVSLCSRRGLAILAGLAVASSPAIRHLTGDYHAARLMLFGRLDSFGVGVLLAVAYRSPVAWRVLVRCRDAFPVAAVAIGAAATALYAADPRSDALYLGLALAYVCLVAAALTDPEGLLGRVFRLAPLRWVGDRCYGIYLLHKPIAGVAFQAVLGKDPELDGPADAVIMIAVTVATLVAADLSKRHFEDLFLAPSRRPATTVVAAQGATL